MHELSIALSILDIAAEESERRGGCGIGAIHLRMGPLSGVVPEALQSAFELARHEYAFSGARLVIEETPILLRCDRCGPGRPAVSPQMLCCRDCGSPGGGVESGRELEVYAMELI